MRSRTSSLLTACLGAGLAASAVSALAIPAPRPATELTAAPTVLALTPAAQAKAAYDRMTTAQRIGQLFMVGGSVNGLGSATTTAISTYHIGNLILMGRATAGAAPVRYLTGRADTLATPAATGGVPLLISADQEGGYVQVLQGPGFSRMPTALTQGSWADPTLAAAARTWGVQVFRSGRQRGPRPGDGHCCHKHGQLQQADWLLSARVRLHARGRRRQGHYVPEGHAGFWPGHDGQALPGPGPGHRQHGHDRRRHRHGDHPHLRRHRARSGPPSTPARACSWSRRPTTHASTPHIRRSSHPR